MNRFEDLLYFYKIDMIRRELNLFSRFFNLIAFASPTAYEAQKSMCILMPEVASIEESVIILNPLYNNYYESADRLIKRMGFNILLHKIINLSSTDIETVFKEKLG